MKNLILFILLITFISAGTQKPKILIIGDSISIGYYDYVKEAMSDEAEVVHNPGNAQHTHKGLREVRKWLKQEDWDIVQFNWGLWDLCYRLPSDKGLGEKDKKKGLITTPLQQYQQNLDSLVSIIKANTDAKLIFVTTTYVPENEPGRFVKDPSKYNKVAKKIMKKYGVEVNDINKKSKKIHQNYGLGDDNVHYTKEGYNELGKLIVPVLRKNLSTD